ncbi:unnamed protein product [Blepharisma stoltei]|uniref:RAP domain-containing protein n=1 Tax=Blepharisma stoltei TaxID=1481888 RepID=A0AAU9IIK1_9CILI|nr:unnamed protein product [Blepharisma stoltei]
MSLASQLPVSKAAVDLSRQILSSFRSPNPDLKTLTKSLDDFMNDSGNHINYVLESDIIKNFVISIDHLDFELNDLSTILYWSTISRFQIPEIKLKNFELKFLLKYKTIFKDNLIKLLYSYATLYRHNPFIIKLIEVKDKSDWTCSDFITTAYSLCVLRQYNPKLWIDFSPDLSALTVGLSQEVRHVRYAINTEAPELLDLKLRSGKILGDALNDAMIPSSSKPESDVSLVPAHLNDKIRLGRMHTEVKYLLAKMMKFNENYNIEDAYIVDFLKKGTKTAIDIDGPLHYFFPDKGEKTQKYKLIGQILMKYRLLNQNGWEVVTLPHFEYHRYRDGAEKSMYIQKKLEEANVSLD